MITLVFQAAHTPRELAASNASDAFVMKRKKASEAEDDTSSWEKPRKTCGIEGMCAWL